MIACGLLFGIGVATNGLLFLEARRRVDVVDQVLAGLGFAVSFLGLCQ